MVGRLGIEPRTYWLRLDGLLSSCNTIHISSLHIVYTRLCGFSSGVCRATYETNQKVNREHSIPRTTIRIRLIQESGVLPRHHPPRLRLESHKDFKAIYRREADQRPLAPPYDRQISSVDPLKQDREIAQEILYKLAKGIDISSGKNAESISLEKCFEDFLNTRTLKEKTRREYKRIMGKYIKDWRQKKVTSISRDMVSHRHKKYWG